MEVLALVGEVVGILPSLVSLGVDVANLVTKTQAVIDANKGPTEDDWNALDQQVTALRAQFAQATQDIP